MYVSAGGCNVSLTTGGGSDLHVLIETVTSPDENIATQPTCGAYLSNTDFPGHDLMKVQHVASRDACCALCANNTQCSAGSWDGPNSKYAKSATCNLKTVSSYAQNFSIGEGFGYILISAVPLLRLQLLLAGSASVGPTQAARDGCVCATTTKRSAPAA